MQTAFARELRRTQTDAEAALWIQLRDRQLDGTKFRRQHPIGPFFVDFASPERKLIIEIDGGHHNEDDTSSRDADRTARLKQEGYQVLRSWNNEVLSNMDGVVERIREAIGGSSPSP